MLLDWSSLSLRSNGFRHRTETELHACYSTVLSRYAPATRILVIERRENYTLAALLVFFFATLQLLDWSSLSLRSSHSDFRHRAENSTLATRLVFSLATLQPLRFPLSSGKLHTLSRSPPAMSTRTERRRQSPRLTGISRPYPLSSLLLSPTPTPDEPV